MSSSDPTYEMLWDCAHCGQKKNLGLTHRHCPACGAAQDERARYFPGDADKVAVADHPFVGADRRCQFCQQLSAATATCCGGCGAPLDSAAAAAVRSDVVTAGAYGGESAADAARERAQREAASLGIKPAEVKKAKRRRWPFVVVGGVLLACVGAAALFFLWKRDAVLEVQGQRWALEIPVQRFGPVEASAWCDQLPAGAVEVRRTREERSRTRVEDGQDCQTRRIDNGDGTFSERQECTPRYREEPVLADKCYYRTNAWAEARVERAAGALPAQPPQWPMVTLAGQGECVGCEREGERRATYTLDLFERSSGRQASCDVDEARWMAASPGSQFQGAFRVIGGGLDCDALRPR